MLHSITGITVDQIQLTIYTLDLISDYYSKRGLDNSSLPSVGSPKPIPPTKLHPKYEEIHDLSSAYIMLLDSIDSIMLLVINEAFSTRSDLIFWDRMLKSSPWELTLYQINNYVYSHLFFFLYSKEQLKVPSMKNKHDMIYHIESLKDDFHNLVVLLGKLNECIAMLRSITLKIESLHLYSSRNLEDITNSRTSNPTSHGNSMKARQSLQKEKRSVHSRESLEGDFWRDAFPSIPEEEEEEEDDAREPISHDNRSEDSESTALLNQLLELQHQPTFSEKLQIIEQFTHDTLIGTIQFLINSINEHLPMLSAINNPDHDLHMVSHRFAGDIFSENPLLITNYEDLFQTSELVLFTSTLSTFFREFAQNNASKDFPFEFEPIKVRRPSNFQRFWLRNVLLTMGGIYTTQLLINKYQDGSLHEHWITFTTWFQSKLQEHVIEPVTKLFQELFHTIRSREHIVSRKDYELSRDALHRMLSDFSKSRQGHELMDKLKDQLSFTTELIKKPVFSGSSKRDASNTTSPPPQTSSSGSSASTASPPAPSNPPPQPVKNSNSGSGGSSMGRSNDTEVVVTLEPTAEQALEALMTEYEQELQTPIKGIISGNLLTAVLIQMQKLKVHTEAAMLTMDQILSSNELTMAATAALPAILLFGGVVWMLKSASQPKSQALGDATKHFQLILSDVERSLEDLYDQVKKINAITTASSLPPHQLSSSLLSPQRQKSMNSLSSPLPLQRQVSLQSNLSDPPPITSGLTPTIAMSSLYRDYPQLWKLKGILSFNLLRLRNKFLFIFLDVVKGSNQHYLMNAHSFTTQQSFITYKHRHPFHYANQREKYWKLGQGIHGNRVSHSSQEEMEKVREEEEQKASKPERKRQQLNDYHSLYDLAQHLSEYYLPQQSPPPPPSQPPRNQSYTKVEVENLIESSGETPSTATTPRGKGLRTRSTSHVAFINTFSHPYYRRYQNYLYVTSPQQFLQKSNLQLFTFFFHSYYSIRHSLLYSWQSIKSLYNCVYQLFFGTNELLSNTTVYESLNRDISLLESPEQEISLSRKLQVTKRMRRSYKMFSPVH